MATPEQIKARIAELDAVDQAPAMDKQAIMARIAELDAADQEPRIVQAALQGFGEGATLGYLPQIQAGAEQVIEFLTPESEADRLLKEKGFKLPEEGGYTESRDAFIQRGQELQEEAPIAYGAGQFAGGMAATAPVGGAAATGMKAMGRAGIAGAGMGAIRNPGDVEGETDPLQFEERIKNMKSDALMGVLFSGGASTLSKAAGMIKNSPRAAKNLSDMFAIKAAGGIQSRLRKLRGVKRGMEIGQTLVDEGVVGWGDDVADIYKKIQVAKAQAGREIDDIYKYADKVLLDVNKVSRSTQRALDKSRINMVKFAKNARVKIKTKYAGKAGGKQTIAKLNRVLNEIEENGDNISLQKLREVRGSVDDMITYTKEAKELPQFQKELLDMRHRLQNYANARVAAVEKIAGGDRVKQLVKLNKKFNHLSDAGKIAKEGEEALIGNRFSGFSEQIGGGFGTAAGATLGGPVGAVLGGLVGAGGSRLAKQYGSSTGAKLSRYAAEKLLKNPAALGKYSQQLLDAARLNPEKFVIAIESLKNDPEFRRAVQSK